ncbi:MAG: 1,4-alpha-glucan branching enzyme, partial [Deltaproteobacteria bacterium]|nr:1,4-alpha-glucan branching enzyme [Deltaproteobacteria bacterium]
MYSREFLAGISEEDIRRILTIEHSDPHSVLGVHPARIHGQEGVAVRAYHPDAVTAVMIVEGEGIPMEPSGAHGLFWKWLPGRRLPLSYRISYEFYDGSTWAADPPYRFAPSLGDMDLHLAGEGKHFTLYEKLGAHPMEMDGIQGTAFAVWAPNAKRVSVIGDFNNWDGRLYPMRSMGGSGIWELFIPGIGVGRLYKY